MDEEKLGQKYPSVQTAQEVASDADEYLPSKNKDVNTDPNRNQKIKLPPGQPEHAGALEFEKCPAEHPKQFD
jgi:hypothetical protein